MVTISHSIHVNKLLVATKPIRNLPTPAAAINEQKLVLTLGIPFLFTPVLSHFFPPTPSPQLPQPRLGDMKFTYSSFHLTSLISMFQGHAACPNFNLSRHQQRANDKKDLLHSLHLVSASFHSGCFSKNQSPLSSVS